LWRLERRASTSAIVKMKTARASEAAYGENDPSRNRTNSSTVTAERSRKMRARPARSNRPRRQHFRRRHPRQRRINLHKWTSFRQSLASCRPSLTPYSSSATPPGKNFKRAPKWPHHLKSQPVPRATSVTLFPEGRTKPIEPIGQYGCTIPAQKSHAHEIHEKAGSTLSTCGLTWPVRGDIKKAFPTKPGWGPTAPVWGVDFSGCAPSLLIAAAKCSLAVVSCRANYGDFRVPALLSAQPLGRAARASPARHAQYRHGNQIWG
jgi:hypothetical protein